MKNSGHLLWRMTQYIKPFLHFSCDKKEIVVVFFPLFLKDLAYKK